MMRSKTLQATLLLSLVLAAWLQSNSWAQESTPAATKPTIESFHWIAGSWQGKALGGSFEETWNPANGGAMMGMFKFVSDDKISFYELLTIVPADDSFVLRLKHFDAGLQGWEEKDSSIEFPLISVSKAEAKFDGLVFTKLGPDRMHIVVQTKSGEKTQELKFDCQRSDSTQPANHQENSAAEIIRIFEFDEVLAKQRDELPKTQSLAVAIESYVVGLKALDFSKCPPEFAEPYQRHYEAWSKSNEFFLKHADVRGEMHEAIEKIRKLGPSVVSELDSHLKPVFETWNEVEKAAAKFGVKQ